MGSSSWLDASNRAARTAAAAIVSGTASELSGGKFANGAVTGAFSRAFNDEVAEHRSKLQINSKKLTANFRGFIEGQIDTDGNAKILLKANALTLTLTDKGWSADLLGVAIEESFEGGMKELGMTKLGTTVTFSNFSRQGFDANIVVPDKIFNVIPSPFSTEIYSGHLDPISSLTNAIENNGMIGDSLSKIRAYNKQLEDI